MGCPKARAAAAARLTEAAAARAAPRTLLAAVAAPPGPRRTAGEVGSLVGAPAARRIAQLEACARGAARASAAPSGARRVGERPHRPPRRARLPPAALRLGAPVQPLRGAAAARSAALRELKIGAQKRGPPSTAEATARTTAAATAEASSGARSSCFSRWKRTARRRCPRSTRATRTSAPSSRRSIGSPRCRSRRARRLAQEAPPGRNDRVARRRGPRRARPAERALRRGQPAARAPPTRSAARQAARAVGPRERAGGAPRRAAAARRSVIQCHHNVLRELPDALARSQLQGSTSSTTSSVARSPSCARGSSTACRCRTSRSAPTASTSPRRRLPDARVGLGWNRGVPPAELPALTDRVRAADALFEPACAGVRGELLLVAFSAQGPGMQQWHAPAAALRAAGVTLDVLYVADPSNSFYLQDPGGGWDGVRHFGAIVRPHAAQYEGRVLMVGDVGRRDGRACSTPTSRRARARLRRASITTFARRLRAAAGARGGLAAIHRSSCSAAGAHRRRPLRRREPRRRGAGRRRARRAERRRRRARDVPPQRPAVPRG